MTATSIQPATRPSAQPAPDRKPKRQPPLDRWGQANNFLTIWVGFVAIGFGLLGTASMVWAYGPVGLLVGGATVDVALVVAVVLAIRAFRTRLPLWRTTWALFKTEHVWRWLIGAPLILIGIVTLGATPFVGVAEFIVAAVVVSVLLREARIVVRRRRP